MQRNDRGSQTSMDTSKHTKQTHRAQEQHPRFQKTSGWRPRPLGHVTPQVWDTDTHSQGGLVREWE